MFNPSYFDLITCKTFAGVYFDTDERNIELFVSGGIKFYDEGDGIDFSEFDFILSHIWAKNIEHFKILGSFHSEVFESFLQQYKYPIVNIYKTKEILGHISEMKKSIENRSVLRCSGTIRGIELRNLLLLQGHQRYNESSESRNTTIRKLGDALGSQTNWNPAYTGKVELGYIVEDMKPIAHIILGFLWELQWDDYISVDRVRIGGGRLTIYLSQISDLTRDLFDRDNEKQILTTEYVKNGIIINGIAWNMKADLLPDNLFKLICLYFTKHRNRYLELGELIEFNREVKDSGLQEKQLTADNLRKNYIKQINLKFRESYDADLLDIKGSIIRANNLIGVEVVHPEKE